MGTPSGVRRGNCVEQGARFPQRGLAPVSRSRGRCPKGGWARGRAVTPHAPHRTGHGSYNGRLMTAVLPLPQPLADPARATRASGCSVSSCAWASACSARWARRSPTSA
ncbi:hypothetical protein XAC3218_990015 [Xanthomonas citri pv. citri]|nr:hypothetical protein XAC908_1130018 [Xanthomonas citri pv. citri]CEJ48776.1 hypothetical protein XAB3213_4400014 [Xanthomonas citri pv. bilvae]CEE58771.1 hypothetical protein XAC3608_1510014 [Xanthomonas citri pv. citri]CEE89713.1 hypothetical protein XAC3218_990015 [Xanthomonas citri pv. citri]CEI09870.1 hypothetical protein XACG115_2380015 [Xanthomonas citri pv. citri]